MFFYSSYWEKKNMLSDLSYAIEFSGLKFEKSLVFLPVKINTFNLKPIQGQ